MNNGRISTKINLLLIVIGDGIDSFYNESEGKPTFFITFVSTLLLFSCHTNKLHLLPPNLQEPFH
jgi:hypothetical protein